MLPPVLANPPWRQTKAPETVAAMPVIPDHPALVGEAGEQERFAQRGGPGLGGPAEERAFEKLLDELDKQRPLRVAEIARLGDEKLGELGGELGPATCGVGAMKLLLGRLGDGFLEQAIGIVRVAPRERGLFEAALPIRTAALARLAAIIVSEREVTDGPYAPSHAEAWLLRHAETAGRALAPLAHDVKAARGGLLFLAAHGNPADAPAELAPWVEAAAELAAIAAQQPWLPTLLAHGAHHRVATMVGSEPAGHRFAELVRQDEDSKRLGGLSFAVAPLPAFFDLATLPRPKLVADGTALPDDAMHALGEMLRFSPLLNPYNGIADVRQACDAASLDALATALLERWAAAGEDPREVWALETSGKIGGEGAAREVATRVRSWARGTTARPGDHDYGFALTGCRVLGALAERHGSSLARVLLDDLARTGVQLWLRKEAQQLIGERELPRDELEAQVPTFGLDPDGSASFDVGTHVYRLTFDEGLMPCIVDEQGEEVASFPRLRKGMDAGKHAAAKARYGAISKDAKTVARYQIALLERMMCLGRTFALKAFRERYLEHPFLRHLGRRVVWAHGEVTFRVADDGTFADIEDHGLALGEHAQVGIIHPVRMKAAEREAWRARFADYRIMQAFPQLGREVFTVRPEEIGEHDLKRVLPGKTSRGRLFQLGRRGWRWKHTEGGSEVEIELGSGAVGRFTVSPAIAQYGADDQLYTLESASCTYALDRLSAVEYSELVRDLEYVRASPT